jgi:hypothetical protein
VGARDAPDDAESEPGAVLGRRVPPFEDPLALGVGDTRAVVVNEEDGRSSVHEMGFDSLDGRDV